MFNLVADYTSRQVQTHLKLFKTQTQIFFLPSYSSPFLGKASQWGIRNAEVIIRDVNIEEDIVCQSHVL